MNDIRLSIIVPTKGRLTLKNTIMSILPQMTEWDEIIVVHDGAGDYWPAIPLHEIGGKLTFSRTEVRTNNNGASQRDHGIQLASGTHLMFCDDDDTFTPDALAAAREKIAAYSENVLVFQMQYAHNKAVLWGHPSLMVCNVGTPMFVVPRVPGLPLWSEFDKEMNVHDHRWINAVVNRTKMQPIFIEKVIAIIRPEG